MVEKFNENPNLIGVIVFSKKNWKENYSLLSRSYRVYGDSWGFQHDKLGHCIMGFCLDETSLDSFGVRLDYYDWKVDYCYLLD